MHILLYISVFLSAFGDTIVPSVDTVAIASARIDAVVTAQTTQEDGTEAQQMPAVTIATDSTGRPVKPTIAVGTNPVKAPLQLVAGPDYEDDDITQSDDRSDEAARLISYRPEQEAETPDETTINAARKEPDCSTLWLLLPHDIAPFATDTLPSGDSMAAFPQIAPDDITPTEGTKGWPVSYDIAADNVVALLLLACLLLSLTVILRSKRFLSRQVREFFRYRRDDAPLTETAEEYHTQVLLVVQTALLAAMMYQFLTASCAETHDEGFYTALAIYFAAFLALFLVQAVTYWFTAQTFFSRTAMVRWMKSFLLLRGMEGLFLLPAVLLYAYFRTGASVVATYVIVIAALFRLLALYRQNIIFFRHVGAYLQNFLYFCALEAMPLAAMSGLLRKVTESLMITF